MSARHLYVERPNQRVDTPVRRNACRIIDDYQGRLYCCWNSRADAFGCLRK